jgi:hypothetical protein
MVTALHMTTRPNNVPSAATVAAVPAIMYCIRPCGGGISHSRHLANPTNTTRPPAAITNPRLNFGVTSLF